MKALRYHGPRRELRLERVPVPELGSDEVLIRVEAAGLCHTELHFLSGLLDLGVYPLTLGHEVVGTIESTGSGVVGRTPGEPVILYYYAGCGTCRWCARGDENLCGSLRAEYGFLQDGGFADYVKAPARNAVPLPDSISFVDAAPIGCGVSTAVHALSLGRVKEDDWVLVYGVGTVGFGLIQLARLKGARVIGVGRSHDKLAVARKLGAEAVIGPDTEPVAERVREITGGEGADVVFELVATRETMAASTAALAKRGRLVFIGYSEDAFTIHPIQLVIGEQSVSGSVGNTLAELREAVELVAQGKVRTIVDRSLPLDRFQAAIDSLQAGRLVGRAVLLP